MARFPAIARLEGWVPGEDGALSHINVQLRLPIDCTEDIAYSASISPSAAASVARFRQWPTDVLEPGYSTWLELEVPTEEWGALLATGVEPGVVICFRRWEGQDSHPFTPDAGGLVEERRLPLPRLPHLAALAAPPAPGPLEPPELTRDQEVLVCKLALMALDAELRAAEEAAAAALSDAQARHREAGHETRRRTILAGGGAVGGGWHHR